MLYHLCVKAKMVVKIVVAQPWEGHERVREKMEWLIDTGAQLEEEQIV